MPLMYLAFRSSREAQELHLLQIEVAELMEEVREIQDEIHDDQRRATHELVRTKETVEQVARAASSRRRWPRLRLELARPE
jgi:FtsZ-binding cell division protein ZapB